MERKFAAVKRRIHEVVGTRNVPILTVELGYSLEFELGEGDADILIHWVGADIMWQIVPFWWTERRSGDR